MIFPARECEVYKKNPLAEVICQIRFPKILELENKIPVEFQKRIRDKFPLLETQDSYNIALPPNPNSGQVSPAPSVSKSLVYEFSTLDRTLKVALASDFVALTSSHYYRWKEFRECLLEVLKITQEIYDDFRLVTRLGLRYRNLIVRSEHGLAKATWRDLISSPVLGILGYPNIDESSILAVLQLISIKLPGGQVAIRYGFANSTTTGEMGYLIDSDFSCEVASPFDPGKVIGVLNDFNAEAGRLFRYCITDKLHKALEPQKQ